MSEKGSRLQQRLSKAKLLSIKDITTLSTIKQIVQHDGVLGLWRGTLPTIYRNVPGSGLYFYTLHHTRTFLSSFTFDNRPILNKSTINLSGGVLARVSVGFVMMPITVIKIRYESDLFQYKSIYDAFKSIIRTEGVSGLFAGFGATAMRDAPFAGIYVYFYEHFKIIGNNEKINPTLVNMTSGLFGGFMATLITQPFDMVKTRIQLKPQEYRNMFYAFGKIVRNESFAALYSGIVPRMLRKSFSSAISWTVYEEFIKRYI
ncbi:hypothetical protein HK103_001545 [Boothiomyces macroporosus]|uniref:Solute carrier family 25 member 38 homolog n=1 Tax=Boothiomyces macroporosus TaxID=261099 RepID=A0AAD5UE14_9FUNG|nr:hypothetical protein HK103_001545 [Boothiomyces macroporosus]